MEQQYYCATSRHQTMFDWNDAIRRCRWEGGLQIFYLCQYIANYISIFIYASCLCVKHGNFNNFTFWFNTELDWWSLVHWIWSFSPPPPSTESTLRLPVVLLRGHLVRRTGSQSVSLPVSATAATAGQEMSLVCSWFLALWWIYILLLDSSSVASHNISDKKN